MNEQFATSPEDSVVTTDGVTGTNTDTVTTTTDATGSGGGQQRPPAQTTAG